MEPRSIPHRSGYQPPTHDESALPPLPSPISNAEGRSDVTRFEPSSASNILQDGRDSTNPQSHDLRSPLEQEHQAISIPAQSSSRVSTPGSNLSHIYQSQDAVTTPAIVPLSDIYPRSGHDAASSTASRNVPPVFMPLSLRPSGRTHTGDLSSDEETIPHSRPSPNVNRQRQHPVEAAVTVRAQFTVPRWQPDAEVTLCPICRTQFSGYSRLYLLLSRSNSTNRLLCT
jgi:hypothetical protein